jgi:hypothetical protein
VQDGGDTGRALKPGLGEIEQTLCCGIKEQFIKRLLVLKQKRMCEASDGIGKVESLSY